MKADLLKRIKIGLAIPDDDTTRDAYLMQTGDGLLARMRARTGAVLYPLRRFRDTFHGTRFYRSANEGLTPKQQPIALVEDIQINGIPVDDVADFPVTTDGRISFFSMPAAVYSEVAITYQAGFANLPDDLLDVLIQLLSGFIESISTGGNPFAMPTKISLVDVGSVEFKQAESFTDLLGPFGSQLDAFGSLMQIGAPLVVESVDLGEVVPPAP